MALPSCSVVVTTCNRAGHLYRSLQSVLGQTVRPLELIVVDDCSAESNDSVIEAARGLGQELRFVRLREHAGAPVARNTGAELAGGEILMFLDDDDAWEPAKIETQLSLFAQRPDVGTVYTGMLMVDDMKGGKVLHASHDHFSGCGWPNILFRNFMGPTSAVGVRTALFRKIGGFDPSLPALQDYDLWLQLCLASPILYDGAHNLRFSAVPQTGSRISGDVGRYQAAFAHLRSKYHAELARLPFGQRRCFDAQVKVLLGSKFLQGRNYGFAVLKLLSACGAYPPTVSRLLRAAHWRAVRERKILTEVPFRAPEDKA
jgi:glycosyltransferase involved in cell wall biosynthesis